MAPRYETSESTQTRRFCFCVPESWPLILGLQTELLQDFASSRSLWLNRLDSICRRANRCGWKQAIVCLVLYCCLRAPQIPQHQHRTNRRRTRPCRHEPLPVWSINAIDPTFRPPPSYYEALHCTPHANGNASSAVPQSTNSNPPPPYTLTANTNRCTTDV
uniref:Uncharacterized protein n=1 Tax=Syphacia muris TaxID=451379 RepID=A0A0N5AEG5_9BILA